MHPHPPHHPVYPPGPCPGAPYGPWAWPAAYPPPAPQPAASAPGLFNDRFLKGLLLGAAATYLITNEQVQRAAIKGTVRLWTLLQGGIEELKERFRDAEAELRAEQGE